MLKLLINKLKKELFGEPARGEKVVIPDLRKLHARLDKRLSTRQASDEFNRWCREMNFGGMHVKK